MQATRAEATVSGVVSAIGKNLPDGSRYVKLDNSAITKDVVVAAVLVAVAIAINVELYDPLQTWLARVQSEL
jgi:hypothetical protein